MRISDWSSEVCSSDLNKGDRRREILRKGGCRKEGHGGAKRDEADRKPERPARRHMPLRPFPRRERHEELVECEACGEQRRAAQPHLLGDLQLDRKSTRLNSSH